MKPSRITGKPKPESDVGQPARIDIGVSIHHKSSLAQLVLMKWVFVPN